MKKAAIYGVDLSKWQGLVEFQELRRNEDLHFAIIKCTEGVGYTDPLFFQNWERLINVDQKFIRGAYHFARPDTMGGEKDGVDEALSFCESLKKGGHYGSGCLPPVIDFEKYTDFGQQRNKAFLFAFRKTVQDQLGRDIMVYTGKNVWYYVTGNWAGFTDCPLWIAQPRNIFKGQSVDMGNLPWKSWTFHQFSLGRTDRTDYRYWLKHKGVLQGIRAHWCDVNLFSGSLEDLQELAQMPLSSRTAQENEKKACLPD